MNDITTAESRRFDGSEPDGQQIERVKKYEEYLDEAKELLNRARSVKNKKRLRFLVKELAAYYESADWRRDFEADEAGLLPKSLKRGVLSEDGIYELLEEYDEKQRGFQRSLSVEAKLPWISAISFLPS